MAYWYSEYINYMKIERLYIPFRVRVNELKVNNNKRSVEETSHNNKVAVFYISFFRLILAERLPIHTNTSQNVKTYAHNKSHEFKFKNRH